MGFQRPREKYWPKKKNSVDASGAEITHFPFKLSTKKKKAQMAEQIFTSFGEILHGFLLCNTSINDVYHS